MFEKLETIQINTFDVKNQLPAYVERAAQEAAKRGEEARAAISGPDELKQRQQYIRDSIKLSLGGLPPSDTPLRPVVTGKVKGNGFRVEKVIFEPRPHVYAAANLYVPNDHQEPGPAVLLLCGHREQAKHCEEYQTACQYLARAGLVVLAVDPAGQGERFSYYDPATKTASVTSVLEHERVGRQCLPLGDNLARYMLHDAMRAVDYLISRPEVDPHRIGVTGHSGGGTQTSLLMMADPRIAAAAPGGFIMNRPYFRMTGKTADAEQKWPDFSAMGLDHEDIILAMAPKPVIVLATTYDSVPIEGAKHSVEVNRRFWEMFGQSDALALFEDADVHRFTVPLVKAAAAFFTRHLVGKPVVPSDEGVSPFPPESLWCTSSGQVIGELADAKSIPAENIERLGEWEAARLQTGQQALRRRAVEWLRTRVYANRLPQALNPRHYTAGETETLQVTRSLWWSQDGLLNTGLQFRSRRLAGAKQPVTIAVWDGGLQRLTPHADWIEKTCEAGRLVLVLNPTGVGPLLPYMTNSQDNPLKPFGVLDKHTDELMLLGDSMAAMRTYDVLRAVQLAATLEGADAADIRLYGHGRYALYAGLAALLEPQIRKVHMEERMESLAGWIRLMEYDMTDSLSFIIPGMLRYFDLPDLVQWLRKEDRLE